MTERMETREVRPIVEMSGIVKAFPGVKALSNVNFALRPGEVHVLFGENGAGKSTLISILSGVYRPTLGDIHIDGEKVEFGSVADARRAGVCAVFQEFSLVPTMTVAENIFLGDEPGSGPLVDKRAMRRAAAKLFRDLDFDIDISRIVASLSRAEQQMVEIAKALHGEARVLILDEPTASLTERETEKLFSFIERAKSEGVGIIYISHRIQEFSAIADRITVLRDGKLIGTVGAHDLSENALIEMMTGRAVDEIYPRIERARQSEPLLSARELEAWGVHGINLDIFPGEVLGVAGLVGSGKSRAFRAIFGAIETHGGKVELKGRDVTGRSPSGMIRDGVFYLPSDRKSEGLMLGASARDNIAISLLESCDMRNKAGLQSPRNMRERTGDIGRKVDLSPDYLERIVSKLSGGNQQKVLFGKGFGADHSLYIFDEPTVGVDMGTRAAIYRLIKQIAESGKAVVVISSDLPEVLHLGHRVIVFANGRITAELEGEAISEASVLKAFFQDEKEVA